LSAPGVGIFILARDVEITIASTIFKIKHYLKENVGGDIRFFLIDNGSSDETADLARRAGAKVIRYDTRQRRSVVIRKALQQAVDRPFDIYVMLDLAGGNSADDAVSLLQAALRTGSNFASGYVIPYKGSDTIGCLAMDRDNLKLLYDRGESVTDFLIDLARSGDLKTHTLSEAAKEYTKRKKTIRRRRTSFVRWFGEITREHPLKFYGVSGMLVLLLSLVSGFFTVDYLYKHQRLFYPTGFTTAALVMIAGFLLMAGLMMNALNVLVERVRASKRWQKATEESDLG
jgi:glycosyltransferase involved in cell wall biosynthesis